jgi:tRNA threonylcarbamoyladenosine biosynthesis protein TsaB
LILSVETSTNAFSLSVFDGREIANLEIVHESAYSQNIVSAVKYLLESVGKTPSDITEAFADIGPGSFTGTRIGVCFVNTLSQTSGIPLLGLTSLDLLAFGEERWYNRVVPFIRSRKNEVYTAFYADERRVTDCLALSKDAFERFIESRQPRIVVSSEDDFRDIGIDERLLDGIKTCFSHPKARVQVQLAHKYGFTSKHEYLKPLYVRNI